MQFNRKSNISIYIYIVYYMAKHVIGHIMEGILVPSSQFSDLVCEREGESCSWKIERRERRN